jgi:TonB-dependent receptor
MLAAHAEIRAAEPTQDVGPTEAPEPRPALSVVVVGIRASLKRGESIERSAIGIVEAIAAEDVLKLPDMNVTDALQRLTGIQVARDRGDGSTVAIRGLTQMETTLNGREVFTGGTGRSFDFVDVPSEMVSSINVYKTPSAAQIEGGIGGLIDLEMHRPLDFGGPQAIASGRVINGDLVRETKAQWTSLLSDRWKAGDGDIGILINAAYQERAFREDQKSTGNPLIRTDIIPGLDVIAPNGTSETTSAGVRTRTAGTVVFQWRPTGSVEAYGEASYVELATRQDSQQINVTASPTFVPGSAKLFPGTDDLMSITWTNAPISVLSFARDVTERTRQAAVGAIWRGERLTLKLDWSYSQSASHLFFCGPIFGATAATFTQELETQVPGTSVGGTNLLDPATFHYTGIAYRLQPFDGALPAVRIDADYLTDYGWLHAVSVGLRHARRSATDAPGLIFGDTAVNGLSAAAVPGLVTPNPYNDFFAGVPGSSIQNFMVGNLGLARDPRGLFNAVGLTGPLPTAVNPLGLWNIDETTDAAYVAGQFSASGVPLDGEVGARIVGTHEAVSGFQSVPMSGLVAPIVVDDRYTDVLPSLTLRYRINDPFVARLAASKTVTRPDFSQLSPSLTLIPNSVNPSLNQGSAGNAGLRPVRADNLDLSIEWYPIGGGSARVTPFIKRVTGFALTVSAPEVINGGTYEVSRPENANAATIRGVEAGFEKFLDFLPPLWRGLGMQANYTYVASETLVAGLGSDQSLPNLSKNSANIIAMYEFGRISTRAAFNWRDRFLSGVTNLVGVGTLPIYTAPYGWLDASINCRLGDQLSIAIEGLNLLNTLRRTYYGTLTRPQSEYLNDRQFAATATFRF